jgi:hypothetical protein
LSTILLPYIGWSATGREMLPAQWDEKKKMLERIGDVVAGARRPTMPMAAARRCTATAYPICLSGIPFREFQNVNQQEVAVIVVRMPGVISNLMSAGNSMSSLAWP